MSLRTILLVRPVARMTVPQCGHIKGWRGGSGSLALFPAVSNHGPSPIGPSFRTRTRTRTRETTFLSLGCDEECHMGVPRTNNWALVSTKVPIPGNSSVNEHHQRQQQEYQGQGIVGIRCGCSRDSVLSCILSRSSMGTIQQQGINTKCFRHVQCATISTPDASDLSLQAHTEEDNCEEGSADDELLSQGGQFVGARKLAAAVGKIFIDQYLPIVLISAIILGFTYPALGSLMRKLGLSSWMVFGIFFISGLTLRAGEVKTALEAWKACAYGMVAILALTPLAGAPVLHLPVTPKEFVTGLAVFCCVPTTLSSGVSLTQAVGANTALALGLTVASNLLGIFTVPFTLSAVLGGNTGISLSPRPLLVSLLQTILFPLLTGVMVRLVIPGAAEKIDNRKRQLSIITSTMLSAVPFMQVSSSKNALLAIGPSSLLLISVIGLCLHLFYLASNAFAVKFLKLGKISSSYAAGKEDEMEKGINRAVIILASQKTLPVSIAVIDQLGGALGEPGLLVLACVAAHFVQVIVDSILVGFWVRRDRSLLSSSKEDSTRVGNTLTSTS